MLRMRTVVLGALNVSSANKNDPPTVKFIMRQYLAVMYFAAFSGNIRLLQILVENASSVSVMQNCLMLQKD